MVARAIAEPHGLADQRRIGLERRRPEAVGEDRRAGGVGAVVGGSEQAAEHRTQPHHLEVRAADDSGAHLPRFAQTDHRELDHREVAELGQRLHPALEVPQLGHREVGVLGGDAGRALPQIDQAVLVLVHQRSEQHAAHDAEDRRVGADPERERRDDGEGETLHAGQRAKGVADVGEEAHEHVTGTLNDTGLYRAGAGPVNAPGAAGPGRRSS